MRVLEIGAGTGYNAALVAELVAPGGTVTTIEIDEDIAAAARAHLDATGYGSARVAVHLGDGALGWPDGAPYDRIILTVGAWDIAPAWEEQLVDGGRLVLPLTLRVFQTSCALDWSNATFHLRSMIPCGFMRLRGSLAGHEISLQVAAGHVTMEAGALAPDVIETIFAAQPRQMPIADMPREILPYSLAFLEPGTATLSPLTSSPGMMAPGVILPSERSACFTSIDMFRNLVWLIFGEATAQEHIVTAVEQWRAGGSMPLERWKVALRARSNPPPIDAVATIQKPRWSLDLLRWNTLPPMAPADL
jgi:hypothetical protein